MHISIPNVYVVYYHMYMYCIVLVIKWNTISMKLTEKPQCLEFGSDDDTLLQSGLF